MSNTTFESVTDSIKDTINSRVGAAVGAIDSTRAPIAGGIESAASTLHSGARTLDSGARTLENTADYLRTNQLGDMWGDIAGVIKAHPTAALIGAVVVGFAAGRLLRR
jgi:hypothetical protein